MERSTFLKRRLGITRALLLRLWKYGKEIRSGWGTLAVHEGLLRMELRQRVLIMMALGASPSGVVVEIMLVVVGEEVRET